MPVYSADAEVEVSVEEFLMDISEREKKELIEILCDNGDIADINLVQSHNHQTLLDKEWNGLVGKIMEARLRLSSEDEEIIRKIANKL